MAFSATVRGSVYLGGPGGIKLTYGDWSGVIGDSAGTLTISGGYPLMCIFQKFDALDNTYSLITRVETAYTAATGTNGAYTTITVENQDNVTTGRFVIASGG